MFSTNIPLNNTDADGIIIVPAGESKPEKGKTMIDMIAFGEKLRNHRKKMNMTQEDVAAAVGVSPQAVSKWENGECLPDC